MRKIITPVNPTLPILNSNNTPADPLRTFIFQVSAHSLIIGSGGPEGVVPAEQGIFYLDEIGAAGSVIYVKQLASVTGDTTLGWVAIG